MPDHDPTDLVGQERDRADREKRELLEKRQEDDDVRWLMSSKRGRRMVWRLMEMAGVFRSGFSTKGRGLEMAFLAGNRNYGSQILGMVLDVCPELFPVMLKERKQDEHDSSGS